MTEAATPADLADRLSTTALAFRGYNVANLGRTPDLLAVPAYRPAVEARLVEAGDLCAEVLGRPVDLVSRVARGEEPDLAHYAEAVAIVFAAELAQVDLLRAFHGVEPDEAALSFGYSLGELVAVAVAGVVEPTASLRVPLTLAEDCAALADDVTMGVVFSRSAALDESVLWSVCEEITSEGRGTIALSSILSPNTVLVLGQGDTLRRFARSAEAASPTRLHVRKNESRWPPLHTPIVRQRNVCDRAAVMLEQTAVRQPAAKSEVLSLVTGRVAYGDGSARRVLRDWVDHPQRLWDGVTGVLGRDVRTVLHLGPGPNLIPATFRRVADNVLQQTGEWSLSAFGMRAVQQLADRPWLASLLPTQSCLLRAPKLRHVVAEDWLLANAPPAKRRVATAWPTAYGGSGRP